ncbi:hypothetical protein U2I54_08000 [Bacillus pseudomycoides]|uniref:Uncharacterized protein n=1 Tax=Bacillus bingmayongensis TaxID=1150157 RepID=A0ABU5JUC5_9BACI|nr:hypothetical protein [Bacillus pseudomycoides]
MFGIFKKFKGTNHKQFEITSIQFHDPIDKMVEKEMAQLKAMKEEEEKRQEEMSKYTKRIESLEELYQVIDALETLDKKYVIIKKVTMKEMIVTGQSYPVNDWYVEEVDTSKVYSDGEEIDIGFYEALRRAQRSLGIK